MALGGALILLNIGAGIAKHILKSWIDSDLLDEISEELIDFVKEKGHKTAEERQQEKDAEKLTLAMTKQMDLVYDMSMLPDNSKQAVAIEVAITLGNAGIDVKEVIAHTMDAKNLAFSLRDSRKNATKLFSFDETALYEQLISEAAVAVVETTGFLQSFPGAFAAKTLQDNKLLALRIEKLLRNPEEESYQFLVRYNDTIKRKLDRLEVFGLPQLEHYTHQQSLSVAYISLVAEQDTANIFWQLGFEYSLKNIKVEDIVNVNPSYFISEKYSESLMSESLRLWSADYTDKYTLPIPLHFAKSQHSSRPTSIESLFTDKRRIVVQGQAGSGKTTLLQWLAVRAASGDFASPLSSWNRAVPFFIRLREYVGKSFPTPHDFLENIAPMIVRDMPPKWVQGILDSGHGLVLVDGVDELPSDQRNAMLERLADLVATYPASRYVISSRPAALKEELWPQWRDWVKTEGFTTTTLRDMDSDLVATFIEKWHQAFAGSKDDSEERGKVLAHASSLKSLLNGRPPLRRLAKNPLLCAMVCALYQERLQNLPSERLKLYEECVEMLLTRRDEGRKINLTYDYPHLTLSQRLALLQDLASWMLENDYSDAEINQVDQRFEWKLPALGINNYAGEQIRRLFLDRTNLLREPVVGRVDFTHLTFQEYLAAREVDEQGNFGELVGRAHNDKWREVIVLALGMTRQKDREKALAALMNLSRRKNISKAKRKQYALLALACLETSVSLEPSLRDEILENAKYAIPPADEDEVKLVASAGDPAVQLLSPSDRYSVEQTLFCIRTLAIIGSENAMLKLAEFASDHRARVRQGLVSAWDNFDRDQYAQTVLQSAERLTFTRTTQLEGVKYLENLVALTLQNVSLDALELAELTKVPKLRDLTVFSEQRPNVSICASIKTLRKFYFRSRGIEEISDLSSFSQLQQITHLGIKAILLPETSLDPIFKLNNLVYLSIGDYLRNPADISSFGLLPHLRHLRFSAFEADFDLRWIAQVKQLVDLSLKSQIVPESFKTIESFSNLQRLSIRIGFDYGNLEPLNILSRLTDLTIELDNSVDFSQLKSSVNLRRLKIISPNQIDISSLAVLTQLIYLDVSECEIDDLTPITKLANLRHLKVAKYHDTGIFHDMKNLRIKIIEAYLGYSTLQKLRNAKLFEDD